ncbi:unnamed protein product [Schistocephalus solidus]|uniref:DUF3105 domain-containing protein n=1 Tax=Schistocephalus solidus TaxID=70667 RepID=A0A183SXB0_SCHSO|nr:unnamed protein product [Schistocephalus solidus]
MLPILSAFAAIALRLVAVGSCGITHYFAFNTVRVLENREVMPAVCQLPRLWPSSNRALLEWEPANAWMVFVPLKSHFTNNSIICVYAPTSAAYQGDKEVERWHEHFVHLFNFYPQPNKFSFFSAVEFNHSPAYAVSCDPPSEGEIAVVNATGEDGIHAGSYKSFFKRFGALALSGD